MMKNQRSLWSSTPTRFFRYTRCTDGISSLQGIFQQVMDGLLQGIEGVIVYIDIVLGSAATVEEHLPQLEKAGMCLQKSKCHFMVSSVNFASTRWTRMFSIHYLIRLLLF